MKHDKRMVDIISASRNAWKRCFDEQKMFTVTVYGMLAIALTNVIILLANLAVTLLGRKKAGKQGGTMEQKAQDNNVSLRDIPLSYDLVTRRKKREEDFMKRANEILALNITNPRYRQTQFCMDLHMERSGVFRIIKRNTGYAVNAYIMHQRFDLAKKLISEAPDRNDRQIAELAGFLDEAQLQRHFTKETGLLPDEYRRQLFAKTGQK